MVKSISIFTALVDKPTSGATRQKSIKTEFNKDLNAVASGDTPKSIDINDFSSAYQNQYVLSKLPNCQDALAVIKFKEDENDPTGAEKPYVAGLVSTKKIDKSNNEAIQGEIDRLENLDFKNLTLDERQVNIAFSKRNEINNLELQRVGDLYIEARTKHTLNVDEFTTTDGASIKPDLDLKEKSGFTNVTEMKELKETDPEKYQKTIRALKTQLKERFHSELTKPKLDHEQEDEMTPSRRIFAKTRDFLKESEITLDDNDTMFRTKSESINRTTRLLIGTIVNDTKAYNEALKGLPAPLIEELPVKAKENRILD